jgi:prepilin-type N-terminal cleavage/methylation domain-containing protein/prepilin-type processing-associated H-X9-DG protein
MSALTKNVAPNGSPRSGFTLLELLVVIAIIGILASLLLPALARGKEAAKKTSCISRLKQWQLALSMYAHDNEDSTPRESFFPNGTTINLWVQVRNPLANDVWYNMLPEYVDGRRAAAYAPMAARADFYDRNKMFHCPKAAFPKGAEASEIALFSYAMNSKLILQPATTMKLSSVASASSTVTFLDNRLPGEPKVHHKQEADNLGQPSAYASRFVARHANRGTLAFADGHVECLPGSDVVREGLAEFPQRRIIWTSDPSVNPNLVP